MRDMFNSGVPDYANATFPDPREFQVAAHDALRAGYAAGHKNQVIMAPTGAGKTYLGLRIAHEALLKGKRALFICDRTTLINQTSAVADSYGLTEHGIIQADHWRGNNYPFQIASAMTLAARNQWPAANVIIVDECHTQIKVWTEYIKTCKAAVVGLSATPFSKGLGKLFSNLINATTMHALTACEKPVLVPMRVFSCTKPNMADAATNDEGEWTSIAAAERGMKIVGDVVTEWIKFAEGRKTIVFAANIAHCEELCRQFNDAGIMASTFTSETSAHDREQILAEYSKPDSVIRVLISVEALSKGFDRPDVGCVVDCRPLRKSLSTAIQMWGRGLRASPDTGKKDCILLDHSGNILRFAEDFSDIFYNGLDALDAGEKLDKTVRKETEEKDIVACPSCGFKPYARRCISCGFEAKAPSLIEHEQGEMREVIIGKRKLADDPRHLYAQLCAYARTYSKPEAQKGRAAHLYKDIMGSWPPNEFRFETTADTPISHAVLNQIRSKNIRHAKGRKSA